MSGASPIQWTDATWNPIRGCSRVSPGCQHCYAEAIAARFSGPGLAYEGLARRRSNGEPQWTGVVRVVESHMLDPIRWRKPRRIFVNSMSDLFHENVTDDTIERVFAVMALADRHTFQILTKRPERMRSFFADEFRWAMIEGQTQKLYAELHPDERDSVSEWLAVPGPLPNVWLGTSVENQDAADERIPQLLKTPAAVQFVSAEPLLGPIDFRAISNPHDCYLHCLSGGIDFDDEKPHVDWVIAGGESGRSARPCDVAWIRSIVWQCRSVGVPAFVKQLGAQPGFRLEGEEARGNMAPSFHHFDADAGLYIKKMDDSHGGDPNEWPSELRVREFPAVRV